MGKANPVPGLFVSPNNVQDPGAQQQFQRILNWSAQVSPNMYAVADPIAGALPNPAAPSNAYLMEVLSPALTFASGAVTVTWPQPFPNGIAGAQCSLIGAGAASNNALVFFGAVTQTDAEVFLTISGTAYTGSAVISITVVGF